MGFQACTLAYTCGGTTAGIFSRGHWNLLLAGRRNRGTPGLGGLPGRDSLDVAGFAVAKTRGVNAKAVRRRSRTHFTRNRWTWNPASRNA